METSLLGGIYMLIDKIVEQIMNHNLELSADMKLSDLEHYYNLMKDEEDLVVADGDLSKLANLRNKPTKEAFDPFYDEMRKKYTPKPEDDEENEELKFLQDHEIFELLDEEDLKELNRYYVTLIWEIRERILSLIGKREEEKREFEAWKQAY